MFATTIAIDATRGYDVLRGNKLLKHFASYEEALSFSREAGGRWIRYWMKKGE